VLAEWQAEMIPSEPDPDNAGDRETRLSLPLICKVYRLLGTSVTGAFAVHGDVRGATCEAMGRGLGDRNLIRFFKMTKKKRLLPLLMLSVAGTVNGETVDTLKSVELQDVQVVATRASRETPVAFTNVGRQELERVNHGQDMPYLLRMTPSVTFSSDAGTGIGYTGIHVRGTDPTRINVTTDGIPMNDAESSQLYWVNMGDMASSMQSVQVQRGVGTSTNGAGAFGATVNMQTEKIGAQPFATLDLSGGSYGSHKETFRFSTGMLGGHWGVQGRLSNIGSDGYIDRASSALNSYFLQGGYFGERTLVKFITFNGTQKTYQAWDYASKADMQTYGRKYNPCGAYTAADGQTAYYDNQTDNYHQQHYYLIWNQTIGSDWRLNAAAHYTRGDGYYEQMKTGQKLYKYLLESAVGAKSDLIRQKKMGNDFYGGVASLNYDNRRGLTAHIGGALNRYNGDHYGRVVWVREFSGSIDPDHEYYRNNAKKTDGNIYGKLNYTLLPGLSAFADLQYRHVDYRMSGTSQEFDDDHQQLPLNLERKYDFFNPKVGLTYSPLADHTLYASYAIAHKEPTRNDFEDMLSETEAVDPQAERLNDLELGWRYEGKRFAAGVNLYWMDYDNQFVLTGAQDANGEMVARNIKDSYRLGAEVTMAWHPLKGLDWTANATLSRNRAKNVTLTVLNEDWTQEDVQTDGETRLAFSPDIIVSNQLSYEWHGLRAALTTKYIGRQRMTNSGFDSYLSADGSAYVDATIDPIFVSDLDLSYTLRPAWVKSATVGLTVYNLFNEEYESNGSCSMNFKRENGKIVAYDGGWAWTTYSAQAPTHLMAYLSISF